MRYTVLAALVLSLACDTPPDETGFAALRDDLGNCPVIAAGSYEVSLWTGSNECGIPSATVYLAGGKTLEQSDPLRTPEGYPKICARPAEFQDGGFHFVGELEIATVASHRYVGTWLSNTTGCKVPVWYLYTRYSR